MVLEDATHGPELCLGAITASMPPHCGGPEVVGWDWASVKGAGRVGDTIDGVFRVVGTYTGGRFTLTEPPGPPDPALYPPQVNPDLRSPCPTPPGGWRPVDASKATDPALQTANGYAMAQPDFAGLWLDQSPNPAMANGPQPGVEEDFSKMVLNVRFTRDLDRHQRELRNQWGGALCVTPATRPVSDLEAIVTALNGGLGVLTASVDVVTGHVNVQTISDDGLQQRLNDKYGTGLVTVTPVLRPVQ